MEKLKFIDGSVEFDIESLATVFISCDKQVFIEQLVCDEYFLIGSEKKGRTIKELGKGKYKVSAVGGSCFKNCFVCVDAKESPNSPNPIMVCAKKKDADENIENVVNAWACVACASDGVEVILHSIDGSEILEDYVIV